MNLFSIKADIDGSPNRSKSRIVALGNLEQRKWSQEVNMRLLSQQLLIY